MGMAIRTRAWTLDMLHALPDDGNKYELVRGELFVTPAPTVSHEMLLARLHAVLWAYVAENHLGVVLRPRAVVRFEDSEVEPDLMVRSVPSEDASWDELPAPILVVEVASRTTHRRDRSQKRQLYLDAGVADYWIVDSEQRAVAVVRPGEDDREVKETLEWRPAGVDVPLRIALSNLMA